MPEEQEYILGTHDEEIIRLGLQRLVDLGRMKQQRAREILAAFTERETLPNTLMITPLVLEIIAVRL